MRKPHVLIVDDSKTIRSVLGLQLRKRNIDVTEAVDGLQGLNLIRERPFDLVITDVIMPKMDGYKLCSEIKKNPSTQTTPVIILSTNEKNEQIEKGFQAGAAAYITKNNASKELFPYVQEILDRSKILRDKLILIVDDSKYILKVVSFGLIEAGFKVITAKNGFEAYKMASEQIPDLILSDVNMPIMDGVELCEKVQKNPDLARTPFVIMSSGGDRRTMRELLHKGASAFLVKPFNIDQLVITAEKLLSDHFTMLLQQREQLKTERTLILGSITSLIQALEARDPYTRGHSDTVADISVKIAQQMSFNSHDLERIAFAARLHDLGKIGIRDDVLLKPGALTNEEYELIKQHPILGAEILRPIPSMEDIIPAVFHHHERMDGQGYPNGLMGNEIPLWARIIAVADVYDALTTDRPYRMAMSHDKAMLIITQNSGTQFCPECVKTFELLVAKDPRHPKELSLAECS